MERQSDNPSMRRTASDRLIAWADKRGRHPLVVRGTRQVGKTWLVEDFGKRRFPDHLVTVDLERRRDLHRLFEGELDPVRILSALEAVLGRRLVPGRDALFLDEIQACPRAIVGLRYFYESLPELHVLAAGSLLEFALGDVSFPVGRVEYLWMRPMTFVEFLWAIGDEIGAETVQDKPHAISEVAHEALLRRLRDYFLIGGMPAAVGAFATSGRLVDGFAVQHDIVTSLRDDFVKYRPRIDPDTAGDVFSSVARLVGSQLKYTELGVGRDPKTMRKAFDLLEQAQLVSRVRAVKHVGLPLGTGMTNRFKAVVVDVGLMQRAAGLPTDVVLDRTDLLGMHNGAVAEQYVGQELRATEDGRDGLYYWSRAAKSSSAEVDYVIRIGTRARAIEVKSGPAGRLRSLQVLLSQHPEVSPGIVLSEAPYAELPERGVVFAPLYFAGSLTKWDSATTVSSVRPST